MVTPEGIALPFTLSGRGTRAGALFLDFAFISILMIATTIALLTIAGGTIDMLEGASDLSALGHALQFLFILWIAAMFLFRNAYFLYFELGPKGATPGKRITGIRIAARDGGRLTAEMVIARNLLRDIELFLPLVFISAASDGGDAGAAGVAALLWFLIFAFFPFFNRDRLRAGDIIAGTWVVEAPRHKLAAAMSVQGAEEASAVDRSPDMRFSDEELAVYGEYELQTLERVLRDNRAEAVLKVQETIAGKIGRSPAPDADEARRFLSAYYTQLRARLEAGMRMGQRKADKHG
nr:RDD family protein [Novosphingobium marinum]